jgi:hypothetical protein
VLDKLDSYTLVIDGKKPKTFHTEKWTGKDFVKTSYTGSVKEFLKSKGITDGYLITVDYHC